MDEKSCHANEIGYYIAAAKIYKRCSNQKRHLTFRLMIGFIINLTEEHSFGRSAISDFFLTNLNFRIVDKIGLQNTATFFPCNVLCISNAFR